MTQATLPVFHTMSDLAAYLGVSKVSVSLALRGSETISRELRESVQELARRSNFTPRAYRRRSGQVNGALGRIAVLYEPKRHSDPVAQVILNHVMRRLTERQVSFGLVPWSDLTDTAEPLDGFGGVLFHFSLPPELVERFSRLPQVAVMHEELSYGPWDSYKPNERLAGQFAADYLLRQGFRKLLLVWEAEWTFQPERHARLNGFRERALAAGAEVLETGYDHRLEVSSFHERVCQLVRSCSQPLGIFAFCDQIAFQLCTMLEVSGYQRCLCNLEVISCDNTSLIRGLRPPLPVVDLHIGEIADRAVDGLIWRMRHPAALPQEVLLAPELICPKSLVSSVTITKKGVEK